jgi:hypothetical protein
MTNADQKLDASLVWDRSGHLGEAALTALVDGEMEVLPDQAVAHAASCSLCEARLGSTALLAVEIAEAITTGQPEFVSARRPLPVAAFVGALAIAIAGTLIQLSGMAPRIMRIPTLVAHACPVLLHGIGLAVGGGPTRAGFMAVGWVAAALLVAGGVIIARLAPARLSLKGPA